MLSTESSQRCQSRFYKEWHPDYIAAYDSLKDKHLTHYFRNPARKAHLHRMYRVGDRSIKNDPTGKVLKYSSFSDFNF